MLLIGQRTDSGTPPQPRATHVTSGSIDQLYAQLAAKQRELDKITNSLGWRLLNQYGKVKYGVLLPLLRSLRILPKTGSGIR